MLVLDKKKIVKDFGSIAGLCRDNNFPSQSFFNAIKRDGAWVRKDSMNEKIRSFLLANNYAKDESDCNE
ncbi:MAG: hypothetical protein EOM55_05220 [Clostridia bacterium]|nr:hypothetical protein [Clostridia bacterium]